MKRQVFHGDYDGLNQDDYYDGKDMDYSEEDIREAEYNLYMRKDPSTVTGRNLSKIKHNE